MAEKLQPVRGTHDLLPADFARHQHVIETAQKVAALYGYARMDTPIFEFSDVFHRTLGDTSDVVTKETYTFTDRGGESLTLRPEFTAAIVRSFISNNLQQLPSPFKCFYAGPAFRYERPQKGRQRQFHQIGCELLGSNEPMSDVEMIALAAHTLRVLDLFDATTLELNSLGDAASRAAYRDALVEYLSKYKNDLSDESKTRLEKNPLRILDSKDEGDKKIVAGAPTLHAHFNDASKAHFDAVRAGLEALGIAYKVSEKLVRGLDYYSHTVFEFTTDKLGAQGTVLAGGRYNDLVKLMGGNDTACIGFAAGVERLSALLEESYKPHPTQLVAVVPIQESTEAKAWQLAQSLRDMGFVVDIGYKGNSKKRFERASKLGAAYAVLMGEEELAKGEVMVKNLADGSQTPVKQDQLVTWLRDK
ncbi:MAG: histidine--tRNA ligase [Rickettsiales bacterium]